MLILFSLKIKSSFCLGILTQNILLDIYTGKDTFQAVKQAYIVGCNRIKHRSEETMVKELHSRSE